MSRGRLQLAVAVAALLLCAVAVISACGGASASAKGSATIGALHISKARMPAPASDQGVIYLTVKNSGSRDDTLEAVTSDVANSGMLMREQTQGNAMQMQPLPALTIPAHGQASLSPGAYHAMLVGLRSAPKQGATVRVTLRFSHAGSVTFDVPVTTYARS